MAQAARQSLRMQKELKLLVTDPPPGASFPFLSPQSDPSPSLSSLLAEIKGPEGTVYEKGVFTIKIQIPERYPFQPPVVTFATPIYHPNIDNGGRICLDILNLPPKGAWQPSLNISTVLTSIGLLLSEPNPDDGLMCEASKEYKYNKHAFDQKARSMTEKFARAGSIGDGSCSKNSQAQSSTITVETKSEIDENFGSNKMFIENASKLSSECTEPQQNRDFNNGVNEKPIDIIERPKEMCKHVVEEHHQHHKNLSWTKRKLSLGSLGPSEQKVDDEKEIRKKKQISSSSNSLNVEPKEVTSHYNGRLYNRDDDMAMTHIPQLLPKDFADRTDNNFNVSKRKNLGLASKRLSLGLSSSSQAQQTDNKENTDPAQSFPFSYTNSLQLNKNRGAFVINVSKSMGETANYRVEHDQRAGNREKQQEMEGSILPDSVIVLDSEDSEEESNGSVRSRLLLARKRLPGKSKKSSRC